MGLRGWPQNLEQQKRKPVPTSWSIQKAKFKIDNTFFLGGSFKKPGGMVTVRFLKRVLKDGPIW